MSTLVSKATGNLTDSAKWNLASAVANAEVDNETSTINVSTSNQDSSTFTPNNLDNIIKVGIKVNANTTPTGTLNIILRNSTLSTDVKTITVNVSDLPASGWFFVSFAAVVADGATAYLVRVIKSSATGTLTIYASSASASNICRLIVLSTTQAPAASDKLIISTDYTAAATNSGTYTITPTDTSAVSYGPTWSSDTATPGGIQVCKGGKIDWDTTASATRILKWKGRFVVYDGGVVGTVSTRVPSTSTLELIMDSTANVDTGWVVLPGGTRYLYGNNARVRKLLLAADASAAATTITVNNASNGASNTDTFAIASTTRTASQCEKKQASNISGATITIAALTNAHSGTSPIQAEVLNLTSNVTVHGTSTSLQGYDIVGTTSVSTVDNVEYYNMGSATTGKRGIDIGTTTGSCTFSNNSLHDFVVASSQGFNITNSAADNITLQNNVTYNIYNNHISLPATTGTSIVIDGNWCLLINSPGSVSFATGLLVNDLGNAVRNNVMAGAYVGMLLKEQGHSGVVGDISGNTAHSNSTHGLEIFLTSTSVVAIGTTTLWRNSSYGLFLGANTETSTGAVFNTLVAFGNTTANINSDYGQLVVFNNLTLNGDTTFATTNGIQLTNTGCHVLTFNSLDASSVSGIKTAHTNDINITGVGAAVQVSLNNSKLGAATELANQTSLSIGSFISSQKHDQTSGLHKTWCRSGTLTIETTTYNTASPSLKMTPNSATIKLDSSGVVAGSGMLYRVANGATVTPTVYVRKDSSYNGNAPRLILKRNDAIGVTADVVLATFSASANTWQQLTGTTAAATDDGVMEFVVDCDGTAGNVFVDDWAGS